MKKQNIDCLLIVTPSSSEAGRVARYMFMPMGILALADYVHKGGYSSKVVHIGVEKLLNKEFSIEEYLKNKEIGLIGISLHWHYHSRDCMDLVDRIKSSRPDIKIVLGGYTATYFADEIMERNKGVDFIIQGDAEVPLLHLVDEISKRQHDYSAVPNTIWRRGREIIHNARTYVADEGDINSLSFTNFKLMEHYREYSSTPPQLESYTRDALHEARLLILCMGRGCPVNCSHCGGSRISQEIISRRKGYIFRSHKSTLESITEAVRDGINVLYICFDPEPNGKYYIELFKLIRKNKINISLVFESWPLPTHEFIDEFKKTFGQGKYSKIILSPETGSEKLRKMHRGYYHTNGELFDVLKYLKSKNIPVDTCFGYPFPHETIRDAKQTFQLIKRIQMMMRRGSGILIMYLDLDPASPMYLYPEKYGIHRVAKSFLDYCGKKGSPKYTVEDSHRGRIGRAVKLWYAKAQGKELLAKASSLFSRHLYDKAIKEVKAAIRLDSDGIMVGSDSYCLLGLCYEETDKHDKALQVYGQARKLFPNDGRIYLYSAYLHYVLNHHRRALKHAYKAMDLGYREDNIYLLLGFCHEQNREYEKAIENLKMAQTVYPQYARINYSLSSCYQRSGKSRQASRELKIAERKSAEKDQSTATGT